MNAKPASASLRQIQGQKERKEAAIGDSPEEKQDWPNCEYCSKNKAEIFQVTGDYCLSCWQEETHPMV